MRSITSSRLNTIRKLRPFALLLKLITGDIDNDIFEVVDKDDLSLDPVVVEEWAEVVFFGVLDVGIADVFDGFTLNELVDDFGHCLHTKDGVFVGHFV